MANAELCCGLKYLQLYADYILIFFDYSCPVATFNFPCCASIETSACVLSNTTEHCFFFSFSWDIPNFYVGLCFTPLNDCNLYFFHLILFLCFPHWFVLDNMWRLKTTFTTLAFFLHLYFCCGLCCVELVLIPLLLHDKHKVQKNTQWNCQKASSTHKIFAEDIYNLVRLWMDFNDGKKSHVPEMSVTFLSNFKL